METLWPLNDHVFSSYIWRCRMIKYKGWIKTPECIHCPLVAHTHTFNSLLENRISINRMFSSWLRDGLDGDLWPEHSFRRRCDGNDSLAPPTAVTVQNTRKTRLAELKQKDRRQQRRHKAHPKHLKSAGHKRRLWIYSYVKRKNWNEW